MSLGFWDPDHREAPGPEAGLLSEFARLSAVCQTDLSQTPALITLHDQLMTVAMPADTVPDAEVDRALASAAYRLLHYEETVRGPLPMIDTGPTRLIPLFETDVANPAKARAHFDGMFSAAERALAADGLAAEVDVLRTKQEIILALDRLHPLAPGSASLSADVHALFSRLYPGQPLRIGDVGLVRTSTALFFLVRYEGERLDVPGFDDRPEAERHAVAAFLKRVTCFTPRFYAHFPAFGFFRGDDINPRLLDALTSVTGRPRDIVAAVFTTMVTIIPAQEADKYLAHDAWGHHWESLLYKFEEAYRERADDERLPTLDRAAGGGRFGTTVTMRESLESPDRWEGYLAAEMAERLSTCLVSLTAEVLADAVEYKLLMLHPELSKDFPSSSRFWNLPAKFDLTILDLPEYFRRASEGFHGFSERDEDRRYLREMWQGGQSGNRAATIDALATKTADLMRSRYGSDVESGGGFTLFGRVAMNYLRLHVAMNAAYRTLPARNPSATIRGAHDLLLFSCAAFYQENWAGNFWRLPAFVAAVTPRLAKLVGEPS